MQYPLIRVTRVLALSAVAVLGLSACGGSSSGGSTTAAQPAASGSADAAMVAAHQKAFCGNATTIGSLTKANSEAMAMSPAESAKDFMVLSGKIAALKADAPTALQADVALIASDLELEQMVMTHKADGSAADKEMAAMEGQKTQKDAAVGRLISEVKTSCGVDIT